ncbi:MAG: hypothetical protein KDD24_08390 [Flavobacteriales bacterium]|nr:hypothetical protein [Flavobacteriales bacterium]MCB9174147.1 hypothetical protein [Flavobacteriales bacterium]
MENSQEIKIGRGLNNILFGISRGTFKKQLGEPTEIDNYNAGDDDEYLTEAWHYDNFEISASFDEEDDWKLTTLSTSSPIATLEGKKVIGMTVAQVEELIAPLQLGDVEMEEMEDDQVLMSIVASSINFWFEHGKLSEVQWGVLWKDEDTPKWPL